MVYDFTLWHPLNLLAALPIPDALAARANIIEAVFFALLNQKVTYNCRHQPLFMKVGK